MVCFRLSGYAVLGRMTMQRNIFFNGLGAGSNLNLGKSCKRAVSKQDDVFKLDDEKNKLRLMYLVWCWLVYFMDFLFFLVWVYSNSRKGEPM